jgi:hypothetical protein
MLARRKISCRRDVVAFKRLPTSLQAEMTPLDYAARGQFYKRRLAGLPDGLFSNQKSQLR